MFGLVGIALAIALPSAAKVQERIEKRILNIVGEVKAVKWKALCKIARLINLVLALVC